MMKRPITWLILFLLFLTLAFQKGLSAEKAVGTQAASFLLLPYDAKSLGRSGVSSSLKGEATCIYGNPAGLSSIKWREIQVSGAEWLAEINYGSVLLALPLSKFGVGGVGLFYLNSGSIPKLGSSGENWGDFSVTDLALNLSFSREALSSVKGGSALGGKSLSIGGTFKIIQEQIDDKRGYATAFDLGAIYEINLLRTRLGLTAKNWGSAFSWAGGRKESLPTSINFGFTSNFFKERISLSM
ncbi:MAG: PorV/PorQ family protein [Candidatus Edwardsbacteria bacterium]